MHCVTSRFLGQILRKNTTIYTMEPKKVMLTTDGKVLVSGENGIVEITDPEFLKYIRKGMSLKGVELDGPAEYTAGLAYDTALKTKLDPDSRIQLPSPRLGPPDIPEKPSKETMDEIAKMFPKLAPEGFVEPDNKTIGPCFPGPFDREDPDSGTFVIEEPKEDINREGGPVNHPKHYNSHPSGIECIVIARWYDFDIGNAIKYIYRHGLKHDEGKEDIDKTIEDLEKAIWYIRDEISMLEQKKKDQQAKCG